MGEVDKCKYCDFLGILFDFTTFSHRSLKFTVPAKKVSEFGQQGLKTRISQPSKDPYLQMSLKKFMAEINRANPFKTH